MWAWGSGQDPDGPSLPSSCFQPLGTEVERPCTGGGSPRRRLWVQTVDVCLRFRHEPTATPHCGGIGDLYWFSCNKRLQTPREAPFPARVPSPGRSQAWRAPLPPCLQQSCPTPLLLPHGRGQTEPAAARGVCKSRAPFPGSCGISCFVPLTCIVPTCGLAAHSQQRTSLPLFPLLLSVFLTEENYPPQESEEMQRMK